MPGSACENLSWVSNKVSTVQFQVWIRVLG